MNILVNLPEGFFRQPELEPSFERLRAMGAVRCASHNTADQIRADLAWANAVIMWSWPVFTAELLDSAPNLKFAGHIDIRPWAARIEMDRGIAVSVSRHGFSPAVAEMALALSLSTLRRISDYHTQMRQGSESWVKAFPTDIDPLERELTGRSVGIIGFGRVGRRLVELLQPFHCSLGIYDPFVSPETIAANGAIASGLEEMIRESDVVTLCAASNPGSRHLLGQAEIALFRKDAVFVNVARAALVDTNALVERLQQGDLFAALDVFDREPLESDSVLRRLPNVYLTPHRAGGLIASVHRILGWLVDDLAAYIAGNERTHALTEAMLPGLDG
jgi:phosphoglycerate dehydrogenase-like enzyme